MAKKKKQEEEEAPEEGAAPAEEAVAEPLEGAEFVPAESLKPKSDVYSLILILTFVLFLAGVIVAGREAWEHYDVQWGMFEKK